MCTQLISNAFRGPEELGWYSAFLPIFPVSFYATHALFEDLQIVRPATFVLESASLQNRKPADTRRLRRGGELQEAHWGVWGLCVQGKAKP
jgi:hypothetical protein